MKEVCSLLESNEAGYDLNSYKTAPPGIRIWGGSTVENKNVELYSLEGEGHTWWKKSWGHDINTSELIWQFFQSQQ